MRLFLSAAALYFAGMSVGFAATGKQTLSWTCFFAAVIVAPVGRR